MDTLQCLCCEQPNPVRAHYCNDCGAPLNLKPCRQCGAVNERPAMHCHACGGEFAFPFAMHESTLGDAAEPVGVPGHAPREVKLRDPATLGANRVPLRALVAGLAAAIALSAYYAYRQPSPRVIAAGQDAVVAHPQYRAEPDPIPSPGSAGPVAFAVDTPSAAANPPATTTHSRAASAAPVRSAALPTRSRKPVSEATKPPTESPAERPVALQWAPATLDPSRLVRARLEAPVGPVHPPLPRVARAADSQSKAKGLPDVFIGHLCREGAPASEACDIRLLPKGN